MRPDPASTPREDVAGREEKPLCAPGESDSTVAIAVALLVACLLVAGAAVVVIVLAT